MRTADELLALLSVDDRPSHGERVRFKILPEACGTFTHKSGHGGKLAVVLDGTGQTVYVTPNQIERLR